MNIKILYLYFFAVGLFSSFQWYIQYNAFIDTQKALNIMLFEQEALSNLIIKNGDLIKSANILEITSANPLFTMGNCFVVLGIGVISLCIIFQTPLSILLDAPIKKMLAFFGIGNLTQVFSGVDNHNNSITITTSPNNIISVNYGFEQELLDLAILIANSKTLTALNLAQPAILEFNSELILRYELLTEDLIQKNFQISKLTTENIQLHMQIEALNNRIIELSTKLVEFQPPLVETLSLLI